MPQSLSQHTRYPASARWLHWGMAGALVAMIVLGLFMSGLPLDHAARSSLMMGHLATGLLLLLSAGVRLRLRLRGVMPELPAAYAPWERGLAGSVHSLFYLLMFGLPLLGLGVWLLDPFVMGPGLAGQSVTLGNLTGWLHWFHYLGAWLLVLALIFHVAGAMRGVVHRDLSRRVLWRMLPAGRAATLGRAEQTGDESGPVNPRERAGERRRAGGHAGGGGKAARRTRS